MKVIQQIKKIPEPYRSLLLNQAEKSHDFGSLTWDVRQQIRIPEHAGPFGAYRFAIKAAVNIDKTDEGGSFWEDVIHSLDHRHTPPPVPYGVDANIPYFMNRILELLLFARMKNRMSNLVKEKIFSNIDRAVEEMRVTALNKQEYESWRANQPDA